VHQDQNSPDDRATRPTTEPDDAGAPPPSEDGGAPPLHVGASAPLPSDDGAPPPADDPAAPPPSDDAGAPPSSDDAGDIPARLREPREYTPRIGRGGRAFWGPRELRMRGDIRAAVLLLLDERPQHGHQLTRQIRERSAGTWIPLSSDIYPALRGLEAEGLTGIEEDGTRKVASLTERGRVYVEENRTRLGIPWMAPSPEPEVTLRFRAEFLSFEDAARQVDSLGTPDQHGAATALLLATRKELYRLIADNPAPTA
jgi:DNA-binding PadR family transcriptional regulator